MTTQTFTDTLVAVGCGECDITFGMLQSYYDRRRNDRKGWYCPNGHLRCFTGETEADRLRREVERQRSTAEYERGRAQRFQESADSARRSAAAARGHITRIKRRVSKGVCPCCNRQFSDLHRHMQSQHPTWEGEQP